MEHVSYSGTLDGDRACTANLPLPGYAFVMLQSAAKSAPGLATLYPFAGGPPYCGLVATRAGQVSLQPRLCSYFEVTLAPPSHQQAAPVVGTCVAIGVGTARFPLLGRMPGWDAQSFGWHSDDGKRFHTSGVGQPFGPAYGVGDTVGCGVDFSETLPRTFGCPPQLGRGSVFFTLNGELVGYAFRGVDVSEPLWPLVGVDTPHPVSLNFGAHASVLPFQFDISEFERRLWQRQQRRRQRSQSLHEGTARAGSKDMQEHTSLPNCTEACIRMGLAARYRLGKCIRGSMHRTALHQKLKETVAAQGGLHRDIGALRTPVLFPIAGSGRLNRALAVHAKQWRLVDSQPVPMSDLLLSWMLRNLRRQRGTEPAATVGMHPVSQPTTPRTALLVEPVDWDGAAAHMIRGMGMDVSAGHAAVPSASTGLVVRARSRTPRLHGIASMTELSPSATFDSDGSWWSDGSEHLELLDGGHISILSAAATAAHQGSQRSVRSAHDLPTSPVPHSTAPVHIPSRLGLGHLQAMRTDTSRTLQPTAARSNTSSTPLSLRALSRILRGPQHCSFS